MEVGIKELKILSRTAWRGVCDKGGIQFKFFIKHELAQ
jgi:hypothetical protein